MTRTFVVASAAVAALVLGCIKPPDIVMVDRATALEQQAGGSFLELEQKLARAAIGAQPVPFTPEQLEALGMGPPSLVDNAEMTDADRVDDLLEQHCAGEGHDGLLVATFDACHGATDHDELLKLVDRVNRARLQLWRWMHEQRSDVSLDELRKRWTEVHARGVACGAWVQGDGGNWQSKGC